MKIILSTYNYYPSHKGGTEVYTKALAAYLIGKGHQVLIVAACDNAGPEDARTVYDQEGIKAIQYLYQEIDVLGIQFGQQPVEDIYANYQEAWTKAFTGILSTVGWKGADQLIMNGISTVSGLSLYDAVARSNPRVRMSIIVHTPFICPKADMIYMRTGTRCDVVVNAGTCASCMIAAKAKMPYTLASLITFLTGLIPLGSAGPVPLRLKRLIRKKLDSFRLLDEKADAWIVFSHDMQAFLSRQSFISSSKVSMIRHGIDRTVFFKRSEDEVRQPPIRFLYAGRFEEVKGIKLLCESWSRIEDDPGKRRLSLAGNWKDSQLGKEIAGILGGRKDVQFLDPLSQRELAGLYNNTHCVLIPSKWIETGPLVLHEAIACGCDVITSDIGGQGELAKLYKERASLFQSGNADSLYKAIWDYRPGDRKKNYEQLSERDHFDRLTDRICI